jgi:hypothetical protein
LCNASYWTTGGFALFTFTLGSGYIAVGLNVGETIGASLIGALISSCIGYFSARPGQDYGTGYVRFPLFCHSHTALVSDTDEILDRAEQNGVRDAGDVPSYFYCLCWWHGLRTY